MDPNESTAGTATADTGSTTTQHAAPTNDAQAAALEQQEQQRQQQTDAAGEQQRQQADEQATRTKNRTRDYINRINRENAELRAQLQQHGQRGTQDTSATRAGQQPAQTRKGGPTLEEHGYNFEAWQEARDAWVLQNARESWQNERQAEATQQSERDTWNGYTQAAQAFADQHPDFVEVVGSIPYPFSAELQAAIAAHPEGPAIAYHLGNNDDDAFALASIQPHLAAAAVDRIAARLDAASQTSRPAAGMTQQPAQPQTPAPKPITKAPPPVPTVAARAPVDVPSEKLTDDDWYARDVASRKKR